jgi:hypothetical protein
LKRIASGDEWRVKWMNEGGALTKERPALCFESKIPSFKMMFPFFLKRKGTTSREKCEVCG